MSAFQYAQEKYPPPTPRDAGSDHLTLSGDPQVPQLVCLQRHLNTPPHTHTNTKSLDFNKLSCTTAVLSI